MQLASRTYGWTVFSSGLTKTSQCPVILPGTLVPEKPQGWEGEVLLLCDQEMVVGGQVLRQGEGGILNAVFSLKG